MARPKWQAKKVESTKTSTKSWKVLIFFFVHIYFN
jgi:hypothetical protein